MTNKEQEEFLSLARINFASVNRIMVHGVENGEPDETRLARLRRWGQTLADADFETAKRCLDAMHRGDAGHEERLHHLSQWADAFPAFVRKWCKEHRPLEMPNARFVTDDDLPRFHCGNCLDSGHVLVLNDAYLDEHWNAIDENRQCPIDPHDRRQVEEIRRWYLDARAWCRSKRVGPLEGAVICDCTGKYAVKKRAENGQRISMGVFNAKRMPKLAGSGHLCVRETAEQFIDNAGDFSERHAWEGFG